MNTLNEIETKQVSGAVDLENIGMFIIGGVAASIAWLYSTGYQNGADAAARDNTLACPARSGP
jgi:hypothetical protein